MTKDVVTLSHTDSLDHAEHLFKSRKIRHIPVVKEGRIIGILSYTDLLRISFADAFSDDTHDVDTAVYALFTLEQVMVHDPVCVQTTQTVKEVAEILAKKEFHALPVVENDRVVGIVTTTDLIKYLITQLD